ncbi:quinone-dependent L-lactate dehydrogenase [Curtobacterium pusillum]|uniref:Alpha-hydroxy-acid oxidizing protein n=1 Tax=Curtobacterium pusillum TaxID=69373 RepID=A0ABX2M8Z2_9MICO|nr:alpha-hydroxy acid oxidase [Curtobacterium pusillum]NUU14109.1 alpha-hydroxy-acid oxidizing protein [Curtobacterium pusillum]GLK32265.1 alpha-hydroxy-acid oxidizing enzyme [Curtobacterium pusillum]
MIVGPRGGDPALRRTPSIDGLRELARRRTPRAVFDFADGAAERESSARRAVAAFDELDFVARAFQDVSVVDPTAEVLGSRAAAPFGIAPIGFTRLVHPAGEIAGARAAASAGVPFTLSAMGTTTIDGLREAVPDARLWMQLYLHRDRSRMRAVLDRAAAAEYEALVVTIDAPTAGARYRDTANRLAVPLRLDARRAPSALRHPRWWLAHLRDEPLRFASVDRAEGSMAEVFASVFDPAMTLHDLAWVREHWAGRLVVKGVQRPRDAVAAVEVGADAVTLSVHGGRQLDRAIAPLHVLPETVQAVAGRAEVHIDSGIRSGADIVAAVALGADCTLVGRAYLYGLMAGGQAGADRSIAILYEEIERTMRLLGVCSLTELRESHAVRTRAAGRASALASQAPSSTSTRGISVTSSLAR